MPTNGNNDRSVAVYIVGEITWDTVGEVLMRVYSSLAGDPKHLFVIISSPGGDRDCGWTLYEILKSVSVPVTTIGIGKVYSASVYPFIAGQERYVFPGTMFLFHPTTLCISEHEEKTVNMLREDLTGERLDQQALRNALAGILRKAPRGMLKRMSAPKEALYLTAKVALKYNLATRIINKLNDAGDVLPELPLNDKEVSFEPDLK